MGAMPTLLFAWACFGGDMPTHTAAWAWHPTHRFIIDRALAGTGAGIPALPSVPGKLRPGLVVGLHAALHLLQSADRGLGLNAGDD